MTMTLVGVEFASWLTTGEKKAIFVAVRILELSLSLPKR